MEVEKTPREIAAWMAEHDRFARLLGMEIEEVEAGSCRIAMTVTADMLNAVGMTHGGATFGLADFAFAVASNSHGTVAVGLTAQINYPAASREGDRLIAVAREVNRTGRTGLYSIEVKTSEGALVALFTGTVYRRSDPISQWMEQRQPA